MPCRGHGWCSVACAVWLLEPPEIAFRGAYLAIFPPDFTQNSGPGSRSFPDRIGMFRFISTAYAVAVCQRAFETYSYFNGLRENSTVHGVVLQKRVTPPPPVPLPKSPFGLEVDMAGHAEHAFEPPGKGGVNGVQATLRWLMVWVPGPRKTRFGTAPGRPGAATPEPRRSDTDRLASHRP